MRKINRYVSSLLGAVCLVLSAIQMKVGDKRD